jgi:hypothetical protein
LERPESSTAVVVPKPRHPERTNTLTERINNCDERMGKKYFIGLPQREIKSRKNSKKESSSNQSQNNNHGN